MNFNSKVFVLLLDTPKKLENSLMSWRELEGFDLLEYFKTAIPLQERI